MHAIMKIDKILFLSFLIILIFSCKKDEPFKQLTYPSVYYKSGIKIAGDLMVFSTAGEIKDPSIINRFLASDSFIYSSSADQIGNHPGVMDSIKLSDAQHAIVKESYSQYNCIVDQEKKELILTRADTSDGSSYPEQFTYSIMYNIGQVKPEVYSEYLISSTRGNYLFGYTGKEKYVLQESNGQLVAPEIIFIQHHLPGYYNGRANNIFQNDFYKSIPTGDTVSIQGYFLLYEKQ